MCQPNLYGKTGRQKENVKAVKSQRERCTEVAGIILADDTNRQQKRQSVKIKKNVAGASENTHDEARW